MKLHDDAFFLTNAEARALHAFTSSDAQRPKLGSVAFFLETGHAVATDGKRIATLAVYDGDTGEGAAFSVPRDVMLDAIKVCRRSGWIGVRSGIVRVWVDYVADEGNEVPDFDATHAASFDFPKESNVVDNWKAIVPDMGGPAAKSFFFDPKLFAALMLVGKATMARMHMFAPESPVSGILVQCGEWECVAMPMQEETPQKREKKSRKGKKVSA